MHPFVKRICGLCLRSEEGGVVGKGGGGGGGGVGGGYEEPKSLTY